MSALLLLTVGCSSPKDANEKNFVRVSNEYYQDHCLDVTFSDARFPTVVKSRYPEKQLQSSVAVGLLSFRDTKADKLIGFSEPAPGLKSALESHRTHAHALVLMNDGWIHSDDYKRMK